MGTVEEIDARLQACLDEALSQDAGLTDAAWAAVVWANVRHAEVECALVINATDMRRLTPAVLEIRQRGFTALALAEALTSGTNRGVNNPVAIIHARLQRVGDCPASGPSLTSGPWLAASLAARTMATPAWIRAIEHALDGMTFDDEPTSSGGTMTLIGRRTRRDARDERIAGYLAKHPNARPEAKAWASWQTAPGAVARDRFDIAPWEYTSEI